MADKALAIGVAGGLGILYLLQWDRGVRWDILVLLLLVSICVGMRDRWIALFGGSVLISYLMQQPKNLISTKQLLTMFLFMVVMDRIASVRNQKVILFPTLAIVLSSSAVAMYHSITKDITPFAPIGNQILSGPIFAIGSVLAFPYSIFLAGWLALVAVLSTSTTAMLCLLAAYSPILVWKRDKILFSTVQLAVLGAFVIFVDRFHAFSARMDMLATTIELGKERVFGWGLGSFYSLMPSLFGPNSEGKYWGQAHNDLVQLFFETGYFPFLIATAFCLWHFVRSPRAGSKITLSLYGAMSAFIVFALLGFPFHFAPTAALFLVVFPMYRRMTA